LKLKKKAGSFGLLLPFLYMLICLAEFQEKYIVWILHRFTIFIFSTGEISKFIVAENEAFLKTTEKESILIHLFSKWILFTYLKMLGLIKRYLKSTATTESEIEELQDLLI
jgi:hypothetical protein